jgi:glycosyltransferase involved in cell wall biosynthesis
MKLLTLAISAYNMQEYLGKCLDSVTRPDIPDTLEVIIVNDGSKDKTSEIAHQYEKRFNSIVRVIDKENGHYGSCINKALEVATGKYFRPLDADDWMNTDALVSLLSLLENNDNDLIVTTHTNYLDNNRVNHIKIPDSIIVNKQYDLNTLDFQKEKIDCFLKMHTMTYKTSILKNMSLKLSTGISYTDSEYCMFPLDKANSVIFYDLDLYQYNLSREGQTMQQSIITKSVKPFYLISMKMIDYFIKNYDRNNSVVKSNQRCFMRLVIYFFFRAALIFSEGTEDTKKMLSSLMNQITQNKELKDDILSLRYRKVPFVYIWYKFKIRILYYFPKFLLY